MPISDRIEHYTVFLPKAVFGNRDPRQLSADEFLALSPELTVAHQEGFQISQINNLPRVLEIIVSRQTQQEPTERL